MFKIAICDDDTAISSYIESFVKPESVNHGLRADVEVFSDGSTLLKDMKKGNRFNLIFLDIEMKEMDGIVAAREIRKFDNTVIIIYVSSYDNYLKDLFEVEPFRFISKPIEPERLTKCFSDACQRLLDTSTFFQYTFNKEIYKVPLNDIAYFESHNRSIYIYFKDGTHSYYYGKLNDVEKELKTSKLLFLRIHQSYYVNYTYVSKMNFSYVTLKIGDKKLDLNISEDRQKEIRDVVFDLAEKNLANNI